MSWSSYARNLVDSGRVAESAIINRSTGATIVTNNQAFILEDGEGRDLVALFSLPTPRSFDRPIVFGGMYYQGTDIDEDNIIAQNSSGGIVCSRTVETIIIGVYSEAQGHTLCDSVELIQNLCSFLKAMDL
eukprot:gene16787-19965_t